MYQGTNPWLSELASYLHLQSKCVRSVCVCMCACMHVCECVQVTVSARVLCFSMCQFDFALYD